jgi:hypothetical protein
MQAMQVYSLVPLPMSHHYFQWAITTPNEPPLLPMSHHYSQWATTTLKCIYAPQNIVYITKQVYVKKAFSAIFLSVSKWNCFCIFWVARVYICLSRIPPPPLPVRVLSRPVDDTSSSFCIAPHGLYLFLSDNAEISTMAAAWHQASLFPFCCLWVIYTP